MRSFRWLAVGCAALLPALASGQTERGFRDSWFWGVKGGVASFSTETVDNAAAPSVGVEWLITRSRFGLYVAGDMSFFDETTEVEGLTGAEEVAVSDLRRAVIAGLFYPKAYGTLRPYAGLGLSVNWIREAAPTRTFGDDELFEESFVREEIADRKDRASFLLMGGLQGQLGRATPFAQVTWQPSQVNFLLSGRPTIFLEAGVRYNVGSAIERDR